MMSGMITGRALRVAVRVCLVVVVGGQAGCSSHTRAQSPLAPPVPVHGVLQMTGGPYGVSQPGVPGRVSFVGPRPGGDTTEVPAAADGTFSLELNPGTYKVTGHSPLYGGNKYLCRTAHDVVVKAGSDPLITVACDRM